MLLTNKLPQKSNESKGIVIYGLFLQINRKTTWISSLSVNMTDLNRIEVVAVVLQKSAISDKFILPLVQDPSIMNSIQHNLKKKPVASFLGLINTTSG